MNSGCTIPFAHPRGRSTFEPLSKYPFQGRVKRAGLNAVVEVAVENGVFNVQKYVIEVREQIATQLGKVIYRR
jgi:hypothetical protein